MMTERLLQFIWQFQYFNKNELETSAGEKLQVINVGQFNTNQGPDFTSAKIRIGETTWAGTVELHLKASDWIRHKHQQDDNYKNVILHVVWEEDMKPNEIPVLELKSRVPKIILERYQEWMGSLSFIPCGQSISSAKDIVWKSWKERLLAERLLRKAELVNHYLSQNNFHWEETFWWLLARNFGLKVNADAFEAIARSIPLTILARQKNQLHQIEALLMGQAGLLNPKFKEPYPLLLQREYRFQQKKFGVQPIPIPIYFLRMRPGNFPTIRLAQLAMLIFESVHLFTRIREAETLKDVRQWFEITANDYWHYHYRFDEISSFKKKSLGDSMIDTIFINTIAPVLFAYGNFHKDESYKCKALNWLEQTAAEKNAVTDRYAELGVISKNAFDSQALLELKSEYCEKRRCLDCAIGANILKHSN